jgi:hypothetical protein
MCTGSIGKKGRINVAPAIENMFPKLELIAIMMNFMMLPKARRGDPALEDAEVVSQQDDVGGVFGNVDGTVDRDSDIARMQRRRVIDAIAEKAHDMAAVLQAEDDPVRLNRRHPTEEARLLEPGRQRLVRERLDFGARQRPGDRNAALAADMPRHALVVAAQDLDRDAACRQS